MTDVVGATHRTTNALRFVKRNGQKILQQWCEPIEANGTEPEWRDVPLEEDAVIVDGPMKPSPGIDRIG
jgi:hypothetical protein